MYYLSMKTEHLIIVSAQSLLIFCQVGVDVACHVAEDMFKALGPRLVDLTFQILQWVTLTSNF